MSYEVVSTRPAARGKMYYYVLVSEGKIIRFKLDPNASQEAIDSHVEEYLSLMNEEMSLMNEENTNITE